MSPKELAATAAAAALVAWFRQYPNQPRTDKELRLWRAIDALEGRATVGDYRENRPVAEEAKRKAAAQL